MKLYLRYDQHTEGGEICEGQEDVSYPDYEPEQITTYYRSAHLLPPPRSRGYHQSVEVSDVVGKCKQVWLALVLYTTGDSFSCTSGNPHVLGVFETADLAAAAIAKAEQGGDRSAPWDGYFNSLDSTEVIPLEVLPERGHAYFL